MPDPQPSPTNTPKPDDTKKQAGFSGILASFQAWLQGFHDYFLVRTELAGIESKAAVRKIIRILIFVAVAAFSMAFASLYLSLSLIYMLAEVAKWGWGWALFLTAVALIIVGIVGVLLSWASLKGKWFPVTIAELKKDSAWLTRKTTKNASAN